MSEGHAVQQGQFPNPFLYDYSRNAKGFIFSSGLFSVALSFISATTVLPSFVAMLTHSEVLIGLSSSLMSGGWLLPQLFIASVIARLPYKRPLMVWAAWISRPLLLLLALIIWLFGKTAPTLTLVVTLMGVFIFSAGDAMVGLPWLDLMARTLPQRRRGRTMGISQIVGGLGGIGAGMIVRRALSKESPWGFPANYALLFATCGIFLLISAIAVTSIREPDSPSRAGQIPSMREVVASLPRILLGDRPFLRLILTRLLVGFVGLATAFYVLHATRNLGFSVETVGLFVAVQVIGLVIAGLMTGVIQDRWGPLAHIRTVIVLSILPPLLALGATPLFSVLGKGLLYYYLLIYLFLGIYVKTSSWPFFTWIMEHATEAQRPLYIGLINTLSAVTMFASALGGVIVNLFSYQAAFTTAAFFAIAAYVLSLSLPDTRRTTADIR